MARKRAEAEVVGAASLAVHRPTMVPANVPNPAVYNPQEMTVEEFESLKMSIRAYGFVEPIVVQKSSPRYGANVIVGGHARMRAIKEICIEDNIALPDIPCIVLDVDDRTAKKLNISLNRIHGKANPSLLGELLEDINHDVPITTAEVRLMGFDDESFSKYLRLGDPPKIDQTPTFGREPSMSIKFTDPKVRDAVRAKLDALATAKGAPAGDVLFELLSKRESSKKRRAR